MSFWLNESTKVTSSRQLQFYMDTDLDISLLPTSVSYGSGDNYIYNLPCGKGSAALAIDSGNIYVLNSSDDWVELSAGSPGGSNPYDDFHEIAEALLDCFMNVAWANENGYDYYNELNRVLNKKSTVVSISANFNQGSAVITEDDPLTVLNQYLTVTANYENGKTVIISDLYYILSGNLSNSTSVITVTYNNKSTTFEVTVTPIPTINVYVGKGVSFDTTQVVDNAKRCISDKVPFNNTSTIKVQWEENTAYRWALKNETSGGAMDTNGGQWTPDMDSKQVQQDSSLDGWIFSSAEQTRWPMEPFASSSGYCRIVFAPLSGMNDALPTTLPSGYITITGTKYKIQIVE